MDTTRYDRSNARNLSNRKRRAVAAAGAGFFGREEAQMTQKGDQPRQPSRTAN